MHRKVLRNRKEARAGEPPAKPAPGPSWLPGRQGQGGEGLSKGYGGSAGSGTGAAGPETPPDDDGEGKPEQGSLQSRDRIAKVLR